MERREFLKRTGLAAAGAAFWPEGLFRRLMAEERTMPAGNARETLDALLKRCREGVEGDTLHLPMVLIALYKMGASPRQLHRYADHFTFRPVAEARGTEPVTRASVEADLKARLPALTKSSSSVAFHGLLRLGYALDYGGPEEIAVSLAGWGTKSPSPDFDREAPPVEPDALLADLVRSTSALEIKGAAGIDDALAKVYASEAFSQALKPIRFPETNPLEKVSGLVMDLFAGSQHFTLLHALNSCQALRPMLPYLGDPRKSLSEFWHSVCAAYLTVSRNGRFQVGRDSAPAGGPGWEGILARTLDLEPRPVGKLHPLSAYEHTVKLVYACWSEHGHYKRDRYLALASRELDRPSPFV